LISIAALVVSGFVVGSVPAHAAASCVVDTFDGVSGSKTLANCVDEISDGGTITFDTTTAQTIILTSTLSLDNADVTIEGPEFSGEEPLVTITQAEDPGIQLLDIQIPNTKSPRITTVKNLKFLNGENPDLFRGGGAIGADSGNTLSSSDLEIVNSHFEGNAATDAEGGAIVGNDINISGSKFESNNSKNSGGAINGDVVSVFKSDFKLNTSDDGGGAIDASEISTMNETTFEGNSGNRGGAIKTDELSTMNETTFDNNTASNDGGALWVGELQDDEQLSITNSYFYRNEAGDGGYKGGAIYFVEYVIGEIIITGSEFGKIDDETSGNKAGDDGGAIEADDDGDKATIRVTDSTFAFNEGDKGGAIRNEGPLIISGSTFYKNEAADGGAIEAEDDVDISDSLFEGNTATADGGALQINDDAQITRTSFVGNKADKHGGAILAEANTEITRSYFVSNEAGAGGSTSRNGGAVWAESALVQNSTFYDNEAPQYGGAIYLERGNENYVLFSTFVDNVANDGASDAGQAIALSSDEGRDDASPDLFANLFIGDGDAAQIYGVLSADGDAYQGTVTDLGANVSTSADSFLDDETSEVSVDYASLGVGTPATATLSLRPFVPIDSISTLEVEVTEDLADNYETVTSETLATVDQQGTTRTYSFYPGAEFIAFGVSSTPAPYSGPLVTSIDSNSAAANVSASDTVTVSGQRLSTVSKVVVGGLEGEVISTSADSFEMVVPEGLAPGNYDLEIQSSIGNLTYLGAFVVSSSSVSSQAFGEVTAWTKRVSDTQVKVYVKYPTVGEKLRIGHQSGGSGSYESVYVKTTASEDDPSMIVNEHGSYIVRTVDLENINRIRVTVGDQRLVQVRYNN
jgi:predicted outer membrane repeat protein